MSNGTEDTFSRGDRYFSPSPWPGFDHEYHEGARSRYHSPSPWQSHTPLPIEAGQSSGPSNQGMSETQLRQQYRLFSPAPWPIYLPPPNYLPPPHTRLDALSEDLRRFGDQIYDREAAIINCPTASTPEIAKLLLEFTNCDYESNRGTPEPTNVSQQSRDIRVTPEYVNVPQQSTNVGSYEHTAAWSDIFQPNYLPVNDEGPSEDVTVTPKRKRRRPSGSINKTPRRTRKSIDFSTPSSRAPVRKEIKLEQPVFNLRDGRYIAPQTVTPQLNAPPSVYNLRDGRYIAPVTVSPRKRRTSQAY